MKRLLTSVFGLGRLPVAPGTFGSIPPAVIFLILLKLTGSTTITALVMGLTILAGSVICVTCSDSVMKLTGKKDPGEIVADELAGCAVGLLMICFCLNNQVSQTSICVIGALGFAYFRFFDILKPWPVKPAEKLPGGYGILADDLVAGVLAGIVLILSYYFGLVKFLAGLCKFDASLNTISASVLGIVQGFTEFLPISSSGHLVLFENIFKLDPESPEMLIFDLIVHLATTVSIFVVFRKKITGFISNLLSTRQYGPGIVNMYRKGPAFHFAILCIITTFVTGVLGFVFNKLLEESRGSLVVVAICWLITGTFLIITDRKKSGKIGLREFGITAALIIGLAQSFAILPGISRSGATICVAVLIGLRRRWAIEYSFLIAIPAIWGATAVKILKDFDEIQWSSLGFLPVLAGFLCSFLTGIIAIKLLVKATKSAKLRYFGAYCYLLAVIILILELF